MDVWVSTRYIALTRDTSKLHGNLKFSAPILTKLRFISEVGLLSNRIRHRTELLESAVETEGI